MWNIGNSNKIPGIVHRNQFHEAVAYLLKNIHTKWRRSVCVVEKFETPLSIFAQGGTMHEIRTNGEISKINGRNFPQM